jgi:hypothetical protein
MSANVEFINNSAVLENIDAIVTEIENYLSKDNAIVVQEAGGNELSVEMASLRNDLLAA